MDCLYAWRVGTFFSGAQSGGKRKIVRCGTEGSSCVAAGCQGQFESMAMKRAFGIVAALIAPIDEDKVLDIESACFAGVQSAWKDTHDGVITR